ncbi:hypothetical protein FCV25MIE_01550 [Fagus crenata]
MPTPIFATDRSSDGAVSLRPNPTASTIHAIWPNHRKSYYRPSHNISDNDSLDGSPPMLERAENYDPRAPSQRNSNNGDGDQLRIK